MTPNLSEQSMKPDGACITLPLDDRWKESISVTGRSALEAPGLKRGVKRSKAFVLEPQKCVCYPRNGGTVSFKVLYNCCETFKSFYAWVEVSPLSAPLSFAER